MPTFPRLHRVNSMPGSASGSGETTPEVPGSPGETVDDLPKMFSGGGTVALQAMKALRKNSRSPSPDMHAGCTGTRPPMSVEESLELLSGQIASRFGPDSWNLAQLAQKPERITENLRRDGEFKIAYQGLLAALVGLGNGSVTATDRQGLEEKNQLALTHSVQNETVWRENKNYSAVLDKLPSVENAFLSLDRLSTAETLEAVFAEMRARPESPLCWSINGNNHFPTHQKLAPVVGQIAAEREKINRDHKLQTRDILIISGNAAQKTPYGPGPLGKFTQASGALRGHLSEAQAIRSLLFAEEGLEEKYEVILETNSSNTRENLAFTSSELKKRGKESSAYILMNTQSGFSGLRSALTAMGWQNSGNLPARLHFLNPDLSPEEALETPSYEFAGKTFLQAMREFMNITADISRELFVPPVAIPEQIIADFKTCLRKLGIEPDTTAPLKIQTALREMHGLAMTASEQRLIDPKQDYASAASSFALDSRILRERQNAIKILMGPIRAAKASRAAQNARPAREQGAGKTQP